MSHKCVHLSLLIKEDPEKHNKEKQQKNSIFRKHFLHADKKDGTSLSLLNANARDLGLNPTINFD